MREMICIARSECPPSMKKCASPDTDKIVYFYNATNEDQLRQAFRDIGIKMTQLYLSK